MASLTKSAKFLKPHHVAQKKNILSTTSIKTVTTQANQSTKNGGNAVAAHLNKIKPVLEKKHLPSHALVAHEYSPLHSNGTEIDLNWSLHQLYIAPQYDAYRNATTKKIVHFAQGKTDANKALVVKSTKEQAHDKFVAGKAVGGDAKELSATHARRVQREIGYHFSVTPAIFVQDGDVGAFQGARIRVVTDNGATGLFLKHMILPIKKESCDNAKYDAQVQVAAAYQFTPSHIVEEFNGPQISDLGLSSEQFIVSDGQANVTTIAGLADSSYVKNAITSAAATALFNNKNALLVNGDSIVSANGNVTLVLGNSANDAAGLYASSESFALYGAHNNVLSEDGLSRFWNGVSYEAAKDKLQTQQYDLVEELDEKTVRLTRPQKGHAIPNLVNKPSSIILLVKDGNFLLPQLSKVNNMQAAADLLASGLTSIEKDAVFNGSSLSSSSHPLDATDRLSQLLPSANVYIINSAYDAKDIQQAIQIVSSGEAKDASELPGSAGKLSTVKHASLKNKAWKDASAFQKQLETLMSKVQQQLQSLPQRPQPQQPAATATAAPQQPQQKQ